MRTIALCRSRQAHRQPSTLPETDHLPGPADAPPIMGPIPSRSHAVQPGGQQTNGNLRVAVGADGSLTDGVEKSYSATGPACAGDRWVRTRSHGCWRPTREDLRAWPRRMDRARRLSLRQPDSRAACAQRPDGQPVRELYIEPTTTLRDTLFAPPLMLTCRVCWSRACAVCKRSFTSQSRRLCRAQGMALYSTCQATDRWCREAWRRHGMGGEQLSSSTFG